MAETTEAGSGLPFEGIPNLRVEREIASGAFGVVYLARDTVIDRVVALKVLRASERLESAETRTRLLGEARAVGGVHSPHVVTLFHVHSLPRGDVALEMEYLDGGSLEDLLGSDQRLPVDATVAVLRGVVLALQAAHEAGIVHGDVKPGNVLRTRSGTFKLADFGLARILGDHALDSGRYGAAGTPEYMAPEVVMEEAPTSASDLWSLGVLAYRMLAGKLPFAGADTAAVCFAVLNDPPPPLGPEVPASLARLVERCLSKRPADRPASAADVLAVLDGATTAPPPRRPAAEEAGAPPVGRETEAAAIAEALRRTAAGAGGVVVISGPAGIGKSALLHHAARLGRSLGRVLDLGHATGHGVVASLLRELRGETGDERSPPVADGTPGEAEQRLWRIERDLTALARERPVVVLVDDVQNASEDDAAALRALSRRLAASRVLWIFGRRAGDGSPAARAGDPGDWTTVEGPVRIDLGALGDRPTRRLAEECAGARLDPLVADRIVTKAGGNPLFAIQLLHHLLETGAVVRDDGTISPGPGWGSTACPPRLQDLLVRRLAGLPAPARDLLDVAAVDGLEFDADVVCAVLDRSPLKALRQLQRLYRDHGLIVPSARGFRFSHPLLRDVVYEQVAPELRREIHARIARFLEGRPATEPERLGAHWHLGGRDDLASPHLREAARRAEAHQELSRAVELAEWSGLVPGRIDAATARESFDLLLALVLCYGELGRHDEMASLCSILLEAADASGDERLRLRVVVNRDSLRYDREGVGAIDEASIRRAAEVLPDSPGLGRARYLLGLAAKYRGDLPEAERWFRGADAQFVACREVGRHGATLDQLASLAMRSGRLHEAENLYADAASVCRRVGRALGAAVSEGNAATAAFLRGEVEGLDSRLEETIRTLTLGGARNQAAAFKVGLARIRYAMGDLPRAQAAAEEAHRHFEHSAYLPGLSEAEAERGHLASVAGDLGLGERALRSAREAAERQGNPGGVVLAWAAEAQRRCFAGDGDAASEAVRGAASTAARSRDLRVRADLLAWASEARLYGLPGTCLDVVEALAEPGGLPEELLVVPRALAAGARAFTSPSEAPEPLFVASRALRGPAVGERRALLRIVADWFEAEGSLRATDAPAALERGRVALEGAHALGHVWLEAAVLRWLDGAAPSGGFGARRRALVDEVLRRSDSSVDAERVRAAWG